MDWIQTLSAVIVIIGANFAFMKFLLRDIHKEIARFDSEHKEFRDDMKRMNMRMDGLYKVILDRTYGIKE